MNHLAVVEFLDQCLDVAEEFLPNKEAPGYAVSTIRGIYYMSFLYVSYVTK